MARGIIIRQPLIITCVAKESGTTGPFIKPAAGAAEGEIPRKRSHSYVEDEFAMTTKHAVIAAACSRKKFVEVALRAALVLIAALSLASCASTRATPVDKEKLSIRRIVSTDMERIDLGKWEMVCEGKKKDLLDKVEGVLVKGISCEEAEHMAFVYMFNEEPFFLAIMGLNEAKTKLTPIRGYGAFKQKGTMLPVPLTDLPKLPAWAKDDTGAPLKSIYKETPENQAIE